MKKVPLHSLVIVIDNDAVIKKFEPHECISAAQVHTDLIGKNQRPELDSIIRNEVFRRIALKLSLGERVIFHGNELSKEHRIALAKMALSQGTSVFYLTNKSIDDGYGEPIDDAEPIKAINSLDDIKNNFDGITLVADVHGNVDALNQAVSWAKSRNHFLWFLGDVIDYGPDPLEALNIVYDLVMNGQAATLIGNHERKIAKWLQGKDNPRYVLRLSEGNKVTINAFEELSHVEQLIWSGKFRAVLAKSSLIVDIDNITIAHAAIHADYWFSGTSNQIENFALYGEPDLSSPHEFKLSKHWIDDIPKNKTVVVGHESYGLQYPIVITSQNGGKVVFLDTGCGKGGPLSTADIQFSKEKGAVIENFNRFV